MNHPKTTEQINIRLTLDQRKRLQEKADFHGMTLTDYILSMGIVGKIISSKEIDDKFQKIKPRLKKDLKSIRKFLNSNVYGNKS